MLSGSPSQRGVTMSGIVASTLPSRPVPALLPVLARTVW
jgi:hypothetical protein